MKGLQCILNNYLGVLFLTNLCHTQLGVSLALSVSQDPFSLLLHRMLI